MQILLWFAGCTGAGREGGTPRHFVSTWNITVDFPLKINFKNG